MKIKILYDKFTNNPSYQTGWGVSFLVDETVLFDTGEDGDRLIDNMKKMKVNIGKITAVVVSHDHWDHTGGVWALLDKKPSITVYACSGFGVTFKQKVRGLDCRLVETDTMVKVASNIFACSETIGTYKDAPISERALAIYNGKGVSIITGCAHPGITKMVRGVMEHFPGKEISLVMGGFHLMKESRSEIDKAVKDFKKMGVEKAAPTHCSGDQAEEAFREAFGENFIKVVVGEAIEICREDE